MYINNMEKKIIKEIRKCIYCNRTLPPKSILDYHKKCITGCKEYKPIIKEFINITINKDDCIVYI